MIRCSFFNSLIIPSVLRHELDMLLPWFFFSRPPISRLLSCFTHLHTLPPPTSFQPPFPVYFSALYLLILSSQPVHWPPLHLPTSLHLTCPLPASTFISPNGHFTSPNLSLTCSRLIYASFFITCSLPPYPPYTIPSLFYYSPPAHFPSDCLVICPPYP